jgi:hypothetical protein
MTNLHTPNSGPYTAESTFVPSDTGFQQKPAHGQKTGLPAALRKPTSRQMRERLETALERLLAAAEAIVADLDQLDGDHDLEEGGDLELTGDEEPILGAPEAKTVRTYVAAGPRGIPLDQTHWADGHGGRYGDLGAGDFDGEEECEDEGAQCEDEGAKEEDDDRPGNDEPWLGSQEGGHGGTVWNKGQPFVLDGEVNCDDEGEPEWP